MSTHETPDFETAVLAPRDVRGLFDATLQIAGSAADGRRSDYSLLLRGAIAASPELSDYDPEPSVRLLENEETLVTGHVCGWTAGYRITGELLAAEFDGPIPRVTIDGDPVDLDALPTVREYTTGERAVEDPFPDATELGDHPDDPLRTDVTTVRIVARDGGGVYGLSYDGTVREKPGSATDYPISGRVHGYLQPGWSATIVIDGTLDWLDTTAEMDATVASGHVGRR